MIVLLSFNISDPSWLHASFYESIHNLGGVLGAWVSDTLFFIFGIIAYIIPIIIISSCWLAWHYQTNHDYVDYFAISIRLIGALILIIASCILADITIDSIWCFTAGGIIGNLLKTIVPLQQNIISITILLYFLMGGLMLFIGLSWMSIFERIGNLVLNILEFFLSKERKFKDYKYLDNKKFKNNKDNNKSK